MNKSGTLLKDGENVVLNRWFFLIHFPCAALKLSSFNEVNTPPHPHPPLNKHLYHTGFEMMTRGFGFRRG